MRDVSWRMGFTLAALGVLLFLGPGVSCNLDTRLMARIQDQMPRAEIAHYLAAVAEGDRQAALAQWPASGPAGSDLQARRESVTEDLLAYGPRLEYRVLGVEWWRTRCEPGVTDDPEEAGAARFLVAIKGEDRSETRYLFDVLQPGSAAGCPEGGRQDRPTGQWSIADVYPQDAAPLAWTWR